MPGELHGGWRSGRSTPQVAGGARTSGATMDLEYGFSCMGYEIAGPWGAAIARARTHPGGVVTALLGDGSYLMLNSELYSAAFAGHPFVAVVCDNGGYAVIHRLQTGQGAHRVQQPARRRAGPGRRTGGVRVDFAAHARSLGCTVEDVPDGCAGRRPRGGVRPGPGGGRAHAPAGGRRLPHPPHDVDRGGRVLGGGRARARCPGARRTTSTRRPRCGGCHEVPATRGDAAPLVPTRPTRSRRSFPLCCEVLMTIVVGYVPTPEGEAALVRAGEEARLRDGEARGRQLDARGVGRGPDVPADLGADRGWSPTSRVRGWTSRCSTRSGP